MNIRIPREIAKAIVFLERLLSHSRVKAYYAEVVTKDGRVYEVYKNLPELMRALSAFMYADIDIRSRMRPEEGVFIDWGDLNGQRLFILTFFIHDIPVVMVRAYYIVELKRR